MDTTDSILKTVGYITDRAIELRGGLRIARNLLGAAVSLLPSDAEFLADNVPAHEAFEAVVEHIDKVLEGGRDGG